MPVRDLIFLVHQAIISFFEPVTYFYISPIRQAYPFVCLSKIVFFLTHQASISLCVPVKDFFSFSPIRQVYPFVYVLESFQPQPSGKHIPFCACQRFFDLTHQASISLCVPYRQFSFSPNRQAYPFECL